MEQCGTQTVGVTMSTDVWIEVGKIVLSAVVGGGSAWLASKIAYSKFKHERTWDAKRHAYGEVLRAFEELQYWCGQAIADHFGEPSNSTPADFDKAHREIIRYAAVGDQEFSPEFFERLGLANIDIYRASPDDDGPWDEDEQSRSNTRHLYALRVREALEKHFPELKRLAKLDLGQKK
jgi:hypothetical protein